MELKKQDVGVWGLKNGMWKFRPLSWLFLASWAVNARFPSGWPVLSHIKSIFWLNKHLFWQYSNKHLFTLILAILPEYVPIIALILDG